VLKGAIIMANIEKPSTAGEPNAPEEHLIEGSRVVPHDYGMPGTKGLSNPIVPLLWLLIPFFFCLGYGIMTR
jgi:hypothetical protein